MVKPDMKRSLIIILMTLVCLLVITLLIVNNKGPFSRRHTSFSVKPGTEITRIKLAQGDVTVLLRKTRDGWTVNDKGEARAGAVNTLLKVLENIAVKSPVSDEAFTKEVTGKKTVPIIVKVRSGRKLAASYYVFRTDSNPYGNIMKRRHGSKAYIVSIPGLEAAVGPAFDMHELFWMPYVIFNQYPSDIERVEVIYPGREEDSFLLCNPAVTQHNDIPDNCISVADTVTVMRYLSYYTWIPFETWAFDLNNDETAAILGSVPLAVISLQAGGKTRSLKIWQRLITREGVNTVDMDRVWGSTGDSGIVFVARYFDLDPLLRRKGYFFNSK